MGVEDAAGEGVVDRVVEDGAEPGHGHEVDLGRRAARSVDRVGVGVAVEVAPEPAPGAPVDAARPATP